MITAKEAYKMSEGPRKEKFSLEAILIEIEKYTKIGELGCFFDLSFEGSTGVIEELEKNGYEIDGNFISWRNQKDCPCDGNCQCNKTLE